MWLQRAAVGCMPIALVHVHAVKHDPTAPACTTCSIMHITYRTCQHTFGTHNQHALHTPHHKSQMHAGSHRSYVTCFRLQLIRVCADHGDAVSALGVYEWMRAPREAGGAALRPTAYTYTAAMRAALAGGMLERAMQVCGCLPFSLTVLQHGALVRWGMLRVAAVG